MPLPSPERAIPNRNNLSVPEGTPESNNEHHRRALSALNDMRKITGTALYISLACCLFAAHQLALIANKLNTVGWRVRA